MKESNIYIILWEKYKPVILTLMRQAIESPVQYQLSKHEFEVFGNRKLSNYDFTIKFKQGVVINDISDSAVARDLVEVLKTSKTAKELMTNRNFKISLSVSCLLKVVSN